MKQRILIASMAVVALQLVGCSSTQNTPNASGISPGTSASTAIADQRLAASEFKRSGVKVYYTLFGDVEAIEVTGYAAVWGGSMNAARESYRVAELEAKKSLNDFINKESIQTNTSVRMISENLEHAQDQNTNKFASNKGPGSDELVAVDEDVSNRAPESSQENQAIRNNALKIASKLQTTISVQNRGILGGLYLKEGSVIDDGRAVKVVMRWDKKHNAVRLQVRNLMAL
jgi:hypothetical protein